MKYRRGRMYVLGLMMVWLGVGVWWLFSARGSIAADLRLLFVGNSYTFGNDLNKLVKNLLEKGIPIYKDVYEQRYAPAGYRFEQHLKDAENTAGSSPLRDLLVTGQEPNYKWDFVFFQEQSQIPGFPQTDSYWRASQQALRGLHKLVQQKGSASVLLMTWGRRKGDPQNSHLFPDYKTMQARLTAGYKAYAATIGTAQAPIHIAPAGLAWERVYDDVAAKQKDPTADNTRFSALYAGDGSHPSMPGSYLTACVIFTTLTGRNPTSITWYPDTSLADTERQYYQKVAYETVERTVFSTGFSYPWAYDWKLYPWPKTGVTGPAIAAEGILPLVRLNHDAGQVDALWIGVNLSNGSSGDGRLWIESGAKLMVKQDINLAVVGMGEIEQRGGVVQATKLVGGPGKGSYHLRGGELQVHTIQGQNLNFSMTGGRLITQTIELPLVQKGGVLAPGPGVVKAELKQNYQLDATGILEIDVEDPASGAGQGADLLEVTGDVKIAGTIELKFKAGVQLSPGQTITILRGKTIELLQGWKLKAPTGVMWQKKENNGTQALVIFQQNTEQTTEATSEAITSEPALPDATTLDASVPEPDVFEYLVSSETNDDNFSYSPTPDSPPQQGCCQATGTSTPWLFLVLLWLVSYLRRRHNTL